MLVCLVILEIAIIGATWIEAKIRDRSWFMRWCYWHLAPLWALWLGMVHALHRSANAAARRTVQRWRYREMVAELERSL